MEAMQAASRSWLLIVVCMLLPVAAVAQPVEAIEVHCQSQALSAQQCSVSRNVYVGWRVYHSACNHCHGQDARGSSFAPDLLASMRAMSYRDFRAVTEQGVSGVMPGYMDNPNIVDHIDALYSYLQARADGRLPAGRPQRGP